MKAGFLIRCLVVILLLSSCDNERTPSDIKVQSPSAGSPKKWMVYKNPEDGGFDADSLREIRDYFKASGLASLFVVYKGNVLLALGDYQRRFLCASIRKSLMNAVYGVYADRGLIDLDMNLDELEIDDVQWLTVSEKQATIRHLLQSRSGVYHPAVYETSSMSRSRPKRGSYRPGEHWYYNNWDFNTLNTIFGKLTSTDILKAFENEVASVIGFEDYREIDSHYFLDSAVSEHPGCSFKMSARDLARFGQLYLKHGLWNGNRILSPEWIEASTRSYSKTGTIRGGYGYLWWVPEVADSLHGFAACGVGTQVLLVIQEMELIIVQRVNTYQGLRHNFNLSLYRKIVEAKNKPGIPDTKFIPLPERSSPVYLVTDRERYRGDYEFTDGMYSVDDYQDGLLITYPGGLKSRLIPKENNSFEVEDVGEIIELSRNTQSGKGRLILVEVLK